MNLHNFHNNPKSLDYHNDVDLVPSVAWEKYKTKLKELKKREKIWARDPKTAYFYAVRFGIRFPLGEPAIAKDPEWSFQYAKHVLYEPFLLGEPAIAKDPEWSFQYAKFVLGKPFKLGELEIAKNAERSYEYAREVLKGRFKLGEPAISKSAEYSYWYSIIVLDKRFKLGEPAIKHSYWESLYTEKFHCVIT